jgi:hypothetical protein
VTEREDKELQDAAGDLRHASLYGSREWAKQQRLDNRNTDASFSGKPLDEVQQLDSLRDAIDRFFDSHLPIFGRITQSIRAFESGLSTLPGGKDEAAKLGDRSLFVVLGSLRTRLQSILDNPVLYKRDVETQRPTNGSSLSSDLKILCRQARAASQQSVAKIEESLGKLGADIMPEGSVPASSYRDLEAIYQGHRPDQQTRVDAIKRHCPDYVVECLNTLNRFMASEASTEVVVYSERVRELMVGPLGRLSTEIDALDLAMERLSNLNTTARCIRAGGDDARLAVQNLLMEGLRIGRDSESLRIESD